jgi:hypothetical protein
VAHLRAGDWQDLAVRARRIEIDSILGGIPGQRTFPAVALDAWKRSGRLAGVAAVRARSSGQIERGGTVIRATL